MQKEKRSQPVASLYVFDLDGTITIRDTFRLFIFQFLAFRPAKLWCVPYLAYHYLRFKLGAISNSKLKELFIRALLAGESHSSLDQFLRGFVHRCQERILRPQALLEIERALESGGTLLLLSASPDIYVKPLADLLGFHGVVCTEIDLDQDGRISGHLRTPNCYGSEKLQRLQRWLAESNLADDIDIIAFADHHSDIPVLSFASEAYIVNPGKTLERQLDGEAIKSLNWQQDG